MKKVLISAMFLFAAIHCTIAQTKYKFNDPALPIDARIKDFISQLTLEEKVMQMMYDSPPIPKLNLPAYNWWNEALHGVGRSGTATVFPQAIGLAATFDDQLAFKVSSAISDEARAMYNAATAQGNHLKYGGLTFWTPNINIFRDPRWGRGQETYGEDPFLTSKMGVSFVKGLQGDDPKYLKVAACAKHFAVHSGPEKLRHEFDAQANMRDLRETYLPAFKALVGANVEAVMCAYNRTNGAPCCANKFLLQDVLRGEWKFKGHVVTDCWALVDFYEGHKVVKTQVEAAVLALKSGVNLNCGSVFPALIEGVKQGLAKESEVDSALATLLRTKFRLGLYDPAETNPYSKIPVSVINSPANRKLSRQVALESMVLLKNNGILPLKNNLPKYYVTGANAANVEVLLGNYYGVNDRMTTYLEGIAGAVAPGSQVQFKPGFLFDRANVNPIDWTTEDAQISNVTFMVMGVSGQLEGEEGESIGSTTAGDRIDYNIPQNQIDFLKKVRNNNKNSIVAIITGGSPMNLEEIHQLADAVILAWYPGEEGGNALAELVFGKVSPSGKLPITFPKSLAQLPDFNDYSMKGRTYRYMAAEPMYPFGYGLSYGNFVYDNFKATSATIKTTQDTEVKATVTNNGKMEADEVVQLYLSAQDVKAFEAPLLSLKGFKRIHLKPGESTEVSFKLTPELLTLYNNEGKGVVSKGKVKVFIGGSSPLKRSQDLGLSKPAEGLITIQ